MGIFDRLFGGAKKDDKKKQQVVSSRITNEDKYKKLVELAHLIHPDKENNEEAKPEPEKKKAESKIVFAADMGYNYSEDDLFLILCLGGIVAHSAGKIEKLDNIYKWFDKNDHGMGLGLKNEQIQIIQNRLAEGDNAAIEIAKKLSQDEEGELFNTLYQILEINTDETLEAAGALIALAHLINPYTVESFIEYISKTKNSDYELLMEAFNNSNLQFLQKSNIDKSAEMEEKTNPQKHSEVEVLPVEKQNKKEVQINSITDTGSVSVNKELEIYSVVGCDIDYSTDDGDICIYRLELRSHYSDVEETDDGVYRFESDWGDEHTGTMQELFELQQDGEEIFTMLDTDEEYVFDEGIHEVLPIDDDDYDTKWGSEEFFITKDEALKRYKEELEFAKNRKHSAGIYINLLWYSSSPR